ncbi:MAG: histidine kinase [Algibacter sp.]
MKLVFKYIGLLITVLCLNLSFGQESGLYESKKITVKGEVRESDTKDAIPNVNIEVNGGGYTTTDHFGYFNVQARIGDELIIRHKDFETVYHIILNDDKIIVEVEPSDDKLSSGLKLKSFKSRLPLFETYIDSAEAYLKLDYKKSLEFITEALSESNSKDQNRNAYELLGDIYMFWEQYDLAVSNFNISLQNETSDNLKLKLAKAYYFNKNYQESISIYNQVNKRKLSNYQLVSLYESLGDVYVKTNQFILSIATYNKGLELANKHLITPKITDLNSKLAEVYNSSGNEQQARSLFSNSLKLAKKENKKRSAEEKIKVADFENKSSSYSEEIQLRKEALEDITEIEDELDNESALTPQRQKYKIGNAYAQQNDVVNAISFLEESIEDADDKADLIVQKDATRRLSEVYRDAGDYNKALTIYQNYVDLVDKLYAIKEQEISQSARFSKDITNKQNRIVSLESDRALSESKYQLTTEQAKLQKLIIYSLIGGVLLLLLTAFLMFKYIKQQRLANNLLALKSLRSQMNPHFIFNALNSINSFIASNDERTANRYLTDFSLLMRAVLENSEEDFIPLEKEIELLELYTKLEHFRFQDKFDYGIHLDEHINVKEFQIPPMLLQPYIENAVWHGLRYKKTKGRLDVNIQQTKPDEISIIITDDGIGRKKSKALKTENQQKQNSKGMGNIKKRVSILNAMYKDKVDVLIDDFQDEEDAGTQVVVTLKKD